MIYGINKCLADIVMCAISYCLGDNVICGVNCLRDVGIRAISNCLGNNVICGVKSHAACGQTHKVQEWTLNESAGCITDIGQDAQCHDCIYNAGVLSGGMINSLTMDGLPKQTGNMCSLSAYVSAWNPDHTTQPRSHNHTNLTPKQYRTLSPLIIAAVK